MKYTIKSDKFTVGSKGEVVEGKELESLGLNIEALVSAGHIAPESAPIKAVQTEGKVD